MKFVGVKPWAFVVAITFMGILFKGLEGGEKNRITFNDVHSNKYTEFVQGLRKGVTDYKSQSLASYYGIPVLPKVADPSERVLYFGFSDPLTKKIIDVAIDRLTVDLLGYCVDDATSPASTAYILRQSSSISTVVPAPVEDLFPTLDRVELPFSSSYDDLERAANRYREDIGLGSQPMISAIQNLCSNKSVPESLIIFIEMVLDAIKFKYIETRNSNYLASLNDVYLPTISDISLVDSWLDLSTQIQRSVNGIFADPVVLINHKNRVSYVCSNASPILSCLALLPYRCTRPSNNVLRSHIVQDEVLCDVAEPTMRIKGRDGLCVDVRDGRDEDGTLVQLARCGIAHNSQKWTFKMDGTIRAMGKCMTAHGGNRHRTEFQVKLYNCSIPDNGATEWSLLIDGTIVNTRYGLVLTSNGDPAEGTGLTARLNFYTATQGWTVDDSMTPTLSHIIGYNGSCLEANHDHTNVRMSPCKRKSEEQEWLIYGDRTIRLNGDHGLCLTYVILTSTHVDVAIQSCQGWASQRWMIRADGTFWNPHLNFFMDFGGTDAIILKERDGTSNQQWVASP